MSIRLDYIDGKPVRRVCECGCGRYLPEMVITLHVGKEGLSIEDWLRAQGLTLEDIRARSNEPARVEIRRRVAIFLSEHGWGHRRIGQFISRDRSTVRALLGMRKK